MISLFFFIILSFVFGVLVSYTYFLKKQKNKFKELEDLMKKFVEKAEYKNA